MNRRKIIRWIKAHKKELALIGIGAGAAILIILGIRNMEMLKAYWTMLVRTLTKTGVPAEPVIKTTGDTVKVAREALKTAEKVGEVVPFKVKGHIRTLPRGYHASPEKIASAPFALMDGQTWVIDYVKGASVA